MEDGKRSRTEVEKLVHSIKSRLRERKVKSERPITEDNVSDLKTVQWESATKSSTESFTESIHHSLSDSVDRVVNALGKEQKVYSYQLVEQLLQAHSNYARSSKRPELDKK